ncbi:MAG: aminotransferase class V-fold PLP-dependent enzyme [Acidimicrobiia bacterium]
MSWTLDPEVDFLNHGSFGAAPVPVLEAQAEIRKQMEAEPVRFMQREREALLDSATERLADFLGCSAADLGLVANATTGVNAVLRSLTFEPGDELLITDHAYNACRNALDYVAARWGASVVVAEVPFPLSGPHDVVTAILERVTPRTRLALLDHVTSPTALVLPLAQIVAELAARGIDSLVDGAHAPGMVSLDLDSIGAAYYAGNCHKWMCAPKGAGFLHVRTDRQAEIVPVVVSHRAKSPRTDKNRFRLLFDWVGTTDPSAALAVPAAIDFMGGVHAGGWDGLMAANHDLALSARDELVKALNIQPPAPDDMLGSMAALPLPDGTGALVTDRDQGELFAAGFEVPIVPWPHWPQRLLRISAQSAYNTADQHHRLGKTLVDLL